MQRQWIQIAGLWTLSFLAALFAVLNLDGEELYLAFSAIAATAIALVSLEQLLSSTSKNTVRHQVYVTAGVLLILGIFTLVSWAG